MQTLQTLWLEPERLDDVAWVRVGRFDYAHGMAVLGRWGLKIDQVSDPAWLDWAQFMEVGG